MFPKEVKGHFLVHTPFSPSARNCTLRNAFLWFCLLTLFIQCQHSWGMCIDYKFTQDLMGLFLRFPSSLGESDIHILKVMNGGQGTFRMWKSLSPREEWGGGSSRSPLWRKRHSRLWLVSEVTGKNWIIFPWKEYLMEVFLKAWSWCGTSSISIPFKGDMFRHTDSSVTARHIELETGEVEPSTLLNRHSEWFWCSGQLDIYFTATPLTSFVQWESLGKWL